jgi:AraC-like DNA-binding protein
LIEDRRFLDSSISLEIIADELNISKGHLSRIINNELSVSFSDYLNNLRVEEAKLYLQNVDFSKYTLVSIGLEAGFNSKSTFNSTFKKFTGLTPSEFKSTH